MKYYELLSKSNLVNQIPLVFEGNKLPASTAANIVLLKVKYNSKMEEIRKELEEVLRNLKKDGYDERASNVEEMERTFKQLDEYNNWKEGMLDDKGKEIPMPKKPSNESLDKANKTKSTLDDFNKEREELMEVYEKAYNKKYSEDIDFSEGLSKEDWINIYNIFGMDYKMEYKYPNGTSKEITGELFLQFIGELVNG